MRENWKEYLEKEEKKYKRLGDNGTLHFFSVMIE